MTSKLATAEQYNALLRELSGRGEHAIDALQRASVEALMVGVGVEDMPPVMLPFTLLGRSEVQYQARLMGFEMVPHVAHGLIHEYIGYLDNTHDRLPRGVRLGVCDGHSYIKLV